MKKKSDFVTISEKDIEHRNGVVIMSLKTYQKILNQTLSEVSTREQRDIEKRYRKPSRGKQKSYTMEA